MPASIKTTGNAVRIVLSGELDFSNQEELKAVFESAVQSKDGVIEVDLEDTAFIDSAIIRLFLTWRETAARQGRSLVIVNCSARIAEIFAIGGFDKIFDIR